MCKYVIKDLVAASVYLPHAIVMAMLVALIILWLNKKRISKGKKPLALVPVTLFVAYTLLVLLMTFLSREDNGASGMYLKLFSSWGINSRNNAYFIENILLFIPLGFFTSWAIRVARNCVCSLVWGLGFSLCIESLQYITGRGVFQVDDILTNGLGMLVGCILFGICNWVYTRRGKK